MVPQSLTAVRPLTMPTRNDTLRVAFRQVFCRGKWPGDVLVEVRGFPIVITSWKPHNISHLWDDKSFTLGAYEAAMQTLFVVGHRGRLHPFSLLLHCAPQELRSCPIDIVEENIRANTVAVVERAAAEKQDRIAREQARAASIQRSRAASEERIAREARLRKFPPSARPLIRAGQIRVGMTPEMVTEAWGEPVAVNRTVTQYGVSEQWVYGLGAYVYFDNGRVRAIQTSR